MGPDRDASDVEASSDFRRRQTFAKKVKYFPLASGELGGLVLDEWNSTPPLSSPEFVHESADENARERRLAAERAIEGQREPGRVRVLEQIAGRPSTQCGEKILVGLRNREHDDRGAGHLCSDLGGSGDATAGHVNVEQANVGLLANGRFHGCGPIGHFSANCELGAFEGRANARARRGVVVRDNDANGAQGNTTSIKVPPPARVVSRNSAPAATARSLMLVSPNLSPAARAPESKPTPSSTMVKCTPSPLER